MINYKNKIIQVLNKQIRDLKEEKVILKKYKTKNKGKLLKIGVN